MKSIKSNIVELNLAYLKLVAACVILVNALLVALPANASDHADPIKLQDPLEPDLTGLFVFPDGENLVFILNAYRGLTFDAPYDLEPFEYRLHLDWDSPVNLTDQESVDRYGGQIVNPSDVSADAVITLRLNNDASLASTDTTGIGNSDSISAWSGVRDDPFIFPRFFGTNVISMVVSIPKSELPSAPSLLVWGTSHKSKSGKQIDHVGRSNRTQLARLDFLNTLSPADQAAKLKSKIEKGQKRYAFLSKWLPPVGSLYELVFMVRGYDAQADVLIYSPNRAAGFPNGRLLTDDVATLTCQWGDCPLIEISYVEGSEFPRQTVNDKDFLNSFPYLAEPWPSTGHGPSHVHFKLRWILYLILILLVAWFGYRRLRTK